MNTQPDFIIIDFDSTIVTIEGLDELAKIALQKDPNRGQTIVELEKITKLGMEGKLSFNKSLASRLKLFRTNKKDIEKFTVDLKNTITPSFLRNVDFFKAHKDKILIVSGGFSDWIKPVAKELGIDEKNVYANNFVYDDKGDVIGFDEANLLAQDGGKVKLIKEMKLKGEVVVIGDGYNDYQIKEAGFANKFFVFTENIERTAVLEKSDYILTNLDEFLFHYGF